MVWNTAEVLSSLRGYFFISQEKVMFVVGHVGSPFRNKLDITQRLHCYYKYGVFIYVKCYPLGAAGTAKNG